MVKWAASYYVQPSILKWVNYLQTLKSRANYLKTYG
jgi:hypothetical protein